MTPVKNELNIDGTIFTFPPSWKVSVFDEWPQYKKPAGEFEMRGCDVIAIDDKTLWIIEMKDYTYPGVNPPQDLAKTIGSKTIGTLALLYSLERMDADSTAKEFARDCRSTTKIHIALHVDVKDGGLKEKQIKAVLLPLKNKVRKAQKALGLKKSFVTSTLAPDSNTPWRARRDPTTRALHADR